MKNLFFLTCFLGFGLTGFAQETAAPKNLITVNSSGFFRFYNPSAQIAYEREINEDSRIKFAFNPILKYNFWGWHIKNDNDLGPANSHQGYEFSVEFMKKKQSYFFFQGSLFWNGFILPICLL